MCVYVCMGVYVRALVRGDWNATLCTNASLHGEVLETPETPAASNNCLTRVTYPGIIANTQSDKWGEEFPGCLTFSAMMSSSLSQNTLSCGLRCPLGWSVPFGIQPYTGVRQEVTREAIVHVSIHERPPFGGWMNGCQTHSLQNPSLF